MTKQKSTKRALLMSALALLMCVSMLIGSTFAWFTDSVTSGNNIIKSGTLDIKMYWSDSLLESDSTEWKDVEADGNNTIFNYQKWEPGYTEVKYIKIVNNGNLSFKWMMNVIPQGTVSELADVIDVYYVEAPTTAVTRDAVNAATPAGNLSDVISNNITTGGVLLPNGETKEGFYSGEIIVAIAMKMQESAGNEYQDKSIGSTFSVQLMATQYTYEEDAFGSDYDANAKILPTANVVEMTEDERKLPDEIFVDGITDVSLDYGVKFSATETSEEAAAQNFSKWHSDFVITFSESVTNRDVTLIGQYGNYDWTPCYIIDGDTKIDQLDEETILNMGVEANTEVRLLEMLSKNMGRTIYINYEELAEIGTFNCGVFENGKVLKDVYTDMEFKDLAGVTVTIELRIYETEAPSAENKYSTNVETGNYYTLETVSYTFE